jgi:hypothetical protein
MLQGVDFKMWRGRLSRSGEFDNGKKAEKILYINRLQWIIERDMQLDAMMGGIQEIEIPTWSVEEKCNDGPRNE